MAVTSVELCLEQINSMDFEFTVAGVPHRIQDYIKAKVKSGDELRLKLEPTNKFDPTAIQVLKGDIHFGYIPKKECFKIREAVQADLIYCQAGAAFPEGCFIHVHVFDKEKKKD